MPWVSRHKRRVPGSWFRTTTVRSHHRRRPGGLPTIIAIAVAVLVILLLIALF